MKAKEIKQTGALILFTPDELLTLSNALNEVCNGLELPEFSTRIGVDREEAVDLLKSLGDLYDEIVRQEPRSSSA